MIKKIIAYAIVDRNDYFIQMRLITTFNGTKKETLTHGPPSRSVRKSQPSLKNKATKGLWLK